MAIREAIESRLGIQKNRFQQAKEQAVGEEENLLQRKQQALKDRLQSQNITDSGIALKQQQIQESDAIKAVAARRGQIDVEQQKQQEALEEAERQRQYLTGEREATQTYQAGENAAQRTYGTQERTGTQDYQAQQAELARQAQIAEAEKGRTYGSAESQKQIEANLQSQIMGINAQKDLSAIEKENQIAIANANAANDMKKLESQQTFATQERTGSEAFQSSQKKAELDAQAAEAEKERLFTGGQAAEERNIQQSQFTAALSQAKELATKGYSIEESKVELQKSGLDQAQAQFVASQAQAKELAGRGLDLQSIELNLKEQGLDNEQARFVSSQAQALSLAEKGFTLEDSKIALQKAGMDQEQAQFYSSQSQAMTIFEATNDIEKTKVELQKQGLDEQSSQFYASLAQDKALKEAGLSLEERAQALSETIADNEQVNFISSLNEQIASRMGGEAIEQAKLAEQTASREQQLTLADKQIEAEKSLVGLKSESDLILQRENIQAEAARQQADIQAKKDLSASEKDNEIAKIKAQADAQMKQLETEIKADAEQQKITVIADMDKLKTNAELQNQLQNNAAMLKTQEMTLQDYFNRLGADAERDDNIENLIIADKIARLGEKMSISDRNAYENDLNNLLVDLNVDLTASDSGSFDEAAYLAANPDVAAAVKNGTIKSGYQHYIDWGESEGRESFQIKAPTPPTFQAAQAVSVATPTPAPASTPAPAPQTQSSNPSAIAAALAAAAQGSNKAPAPSTSANNSYGIQGIKKQGNGYLGINGRVYSSEEAAAESIWTYQQALKKSLAGQR